MANRQGRRRLGGRLRVAGVLAAFLLLLGACGGSDRQTSQPSPTKAPAAKVTASWLPSAGYVTLVIAQEKGLFAEENLEVERTQVQDVSASVAAVVGGSQQFGLATIGSIAVARQQGLDVKVVAPYYYSNGDLGMYVRAGSPIRRARDLEGMTVGFGQLLSSGNAAMLEAVAKDGGDPKKVTFRLVPLATAAATLREGKIDVTMIAEPAIALAGDAITPVIRDFHESVAKNAPIGYAFTSADYYKQHPDVVNRFRAALLKANSLAAANPQVVRDAVVSFSGIKADVVARMTLPAYGVDLKKQEALAELNLMKKYGYIEKVPTIDELFLGN